jgi:hypothetical protein
LELLFPGMAKCVINVHQPVTGVACCGTISVNPAHLGRVERGNRPPTEQIAAGLDAVFPERRGWFTDWLSESREWPEVPATFRSWPDYEDRAASIRIWTPGIVDGLAQASDYARALIAVQPGVTPDAASDRLTARTERQARVLDRQGRGTGRGEGWAEIRLRGRVAVWQPARCSGRRWAG